MSLDVFLSDARLWLMTHRVTPETVIICVLIAAAVAIFLLRFFRPPRV